MAFQIACKYQKTGITGITGSEIFVRYQPKLPDTDTHRTHKWQEKEYILDMEISGEHEPIF